MFPRRSTTVRLHRRKALRTSPPTFSLRELLLFGVAVAILCGLRWFAIAVLITLYAAIYFACCGLGWSLTRRGEAQLASLISEPELRDRSTLPALVTVILCNLTVYFCWHVLILLSANFNTFAQFFFSPVVGGFSLYSLQQLTLVLLHTALLLTFFGNCWNAPRVDPTECRTTAVFSLLLLFCHLAHPWAAEKWLELYFWLWPPVWPRIN